MIEKTRNSLVDFSAARVQPAQVTPEAMVGRDLQGRGRQPDGHQEGGGNVACVGVCGLLKWPRTRSCGDLAGFVMLSRKCCRYLVLSADFR
eukprot:5606587-Prymnesium_polylepis.1